MQKPSSAMLSVTSIIVLVSALMQCLPSLFIYQRTILLSEPWRLWTAHFVHVSWLHYMLNMLAFSSLAWIFPKFKVSQLIGLLVIMPPLLSLGLWQFLPDLIAYAGLSGILHGLFIYAVILSYSTTHDAERQFALGVGVIIIIKVLIEFITQSSQTAQLIGATVVLPAHQIGLILGIILACVHIFKITQARNIN